MNKSAIKNFATWARKDLMKQVSQKAFEYGITKTSIPENDVDSIQGRLLTSQEKKELKQLIDQINKYGYDHVIEEVAYTWFNRFIALRFMEVNNYLPQRIRVFTNENNEFKPELLEEAIHVELEGLDKNKVFDMIENNQREDLYKYLLLCLCNDMKQYLPDMFTSIEDYKALLMPDNLLKEDSVLGKLISDIDENDWKDSDDEFSDNAITIIGWMYQYYCSERHNQVVSISKGAIRKEDIPAATELFTTDWVVRYMVDNSLGRYWIERNPESPLRNKLKFLATAKDGSIPIVENDPKQPEKLTFLDPSMGSGHILAYAFDILMEIYRESGWRDRDAAVSIVENNLYGLDIDERAYQLAYFSIMMKGCKYNRRFLKKKVKTNLAGFVETNQIDSLAYEGMKENKEVNEISQYLLHTFKDALELGSLIEVAPKNYDFYLQFIDEIYEDGEITLDSTEWMESTYFLASKLAKQAEILSKKYCIVTTNPPYMSKMSGKLKQFVTNNYKDYSSDLFAVFIKRNFEFANKNGYLGFMTPFVWMFIKSYEKLRNYILLNKSITTLIQMEYSAYEEATVPICSFVLKNEKDNHLGYYYRLSDFKGGMEVQMQKVLEANQNEECEYFYETDSNNFSKIPGSPIAYWASHRIFDIFFNATEMGKLVPVKKGLDTGNNDRFLRLWFEIDKNKLGINYKNSKDFSNENFKWAPHDKGGEFRRWFGNLEWIINWENNGMELHNSKANLRSEKLYFKNAITWGSLSSGKISFRRSDYGALSNTAGSSLYPDDSVFLSYLTFLNSVVSQYLIDFISPTLNYSAGPISTVPILEEIFKNESTKIGLINIEESKKDWDSFETSWDFTVHPLVKNKVSTVSEAYSLWATECLERFDTLKANEEELNRIFIDIYGLQDELDPYVEDKDVTVRKADLTRDVKSLISYAVGYMFGRYSLDVEGLAFAGGDFDTSKYSTFIPDEDNILPICDEEYFEDDIVTRFIEFVRVVYGSDTLEENLEFVASALGGKGTPREVLRNYFLNDFYKDHCKIYQKRPIYWLFDSGKKNGFKSLVYIHRYTPDLIARMRTGYVHPQQARYRTQIELLENQIEEASSTSERVRLNKQLKKVSEQAAELAKYEEIVHHWADKMEPMDLDDGVKVNYEKFKDLLGKIK